MDKINCFAYGSKNKICTAMKATACDNCAFYRTHEGQESAQIKAFARLKSLAEISQEHIADKYFKGSQPWKAGCAL